jgi:hypothetical protein
VIAQSLSIPAVQRHIRQAWRRVVLPASTSRDATLLLGALVVADTSLDELLIAEGWPGETTGYRLEHAKNSFSDYAAVLAARHIRHQAVHHLDFHLCWRAVQTALAAYAQGLWEHGVDLRDCRRMEEYLHAPRSMTG